MQQRDNRETGQWDKRNNKGRRGQWDNRPRGNEVMGEWVMSHRTIGQQDSEIMGNGDGTMGQQDNEVMKQWRNVTT